MNKNKQNNTNEKIEPSLVPTLSGLQRENIELKSSAYDVMAEIERLRVLLQQINAKIQSNLAEINKSNE